MTSSVSFDVRGFLDGHVRFGSGEHQRRVEFTRGGEFVDFRVHVLDGFNFEEFLEILRQGVQELLVFEASSNCSTIPKTLEAILAKFAVNSTSFISCALSILCVT